MTQTSIPVIAEERVETPLSTPERPMYFTRIKRLLLADESTIYACTECDYTADSPAKVRPHLAVHGEGRKARSNGHGPDLSVTLGELLEAHRRAEVLMATVARQADDLADWRDRARRAERDLETLRRVFNGATR